MIQHRLGAGEYNVRRTECETAVRKLAKALPGIRACGTFRCPIWKVIVNSLAKTIHKRCRHVITENQRTVEAATALETGHVEALRRVMAIFASESSRRLRSKLS